ncbi:hypothetical protein QFC21_005983 [Naganishia friedmannii]|uniref:Uncharacterized protein n=1 Tax=Naganishia friedmannii TaxID=89922 RepID=A0ACC2V5K2_9TREE|nr:hypothetical protein QFC21_005983 [Naganishia friedmannii]
MTGNATGIARRKANAVFVILVRNSELWQIVDSIKQLEDRFNWWANYDYVFLNDEPFEEKFKTYTRKLTRANCQYGLIEANQWKQPEWIDEEKARAAREIPTLWDAVKDFTQQHPEYVAADNSMEFISEDGGETYNLCHFWSNFEIADLNFWRSDAYMDFYTHLEKTGGFWYERWGDAPVHSIAAALFLAKSQVHYFDDIGYKHSVYQHCPQGELHTQGRCWCDESDDFANDGYSCTSRYLELVRDR